MDPGAAESAVAPVLQADPVLEVMADRLVLLVLNHRVLLAAEATEAHILALLPCCTHHHHLLVAKGVVVRMAMAEMVAIPAVGRSVQWLSRCHAGL